MANNENGKTIIMKCLAGGKAYPAIVSELKVGATINVYGRAKIKKGAAPGTRPNRVFFIHGKNVPRTVNAEQS